MTGVQTCALPISSKKSQIAVSQTVLNNQLNVRQTEILVRKFSGKKSKIKKAKKTVSPEISSLEDQIRTLLGTKVTLNHGKKGGTIVIHYYSEEELNTLIDRFKKY